MSTKENIRFKGLSKANTTSLKGVVNMRNGRYGAQLQAWMNGKEVNQHLGTSATKKEAGLAYNGVAIARCAVAYVNFPRHVHEKIVDKNRRAI